MDNFNTDFLIEEDDLINIDDDYLVTERCVLCGEYLVECECNEYDDW